MSQKTHSPGHSWATRHLLKTPVATAAWAFQEKLEQSQWWSEEAHREVRSLRLKALLAHAIVNVPHYRKAFAGLQEAELTPALWRQLPIVTREMLQTDPEAFIADRLPQGHGKTTTASSSGSTGMPITVAHSEMSSGWHRAMTLRSQLWALDRFDRRLGVIRHYPPGRAQHPDGLATERWANEAILPFATGPAAALRVQTPLDQQVEWLLRTRPQVLVSYPSNLEALAQYLLDRRIGLPLKKLLTLGESMPDGLRGLARRAFGASIADTYSAAEVGEMAIQCPSSDAYHVQCEAVHLEVLRPDGSPCAAGETGEVVVTPLHNFATPLLRYAIGDLAVVGKPCNCGRGLPTLSRVLGRVRNLMAAPDGSRFWPSFGIREYGAIAPVRQARFIQHSLHDLEVILVTERELTGEEEAAIRLIIHRRLPWPIAVRFSNPGQIERTAGGKFEEFTCLVQNGKKEVFN